MPHVQDLWFMTIVVGGDRCALACYGIISLILSVSWCLMMISTCSMCATCTTVCYCDSVWLGPCSSVHTTPCARSRGYSASWTGLAPVPLNVHVHHLHFHTCCNRITRHVTVHDVWDVGFKGKCSLQVLFYIPVAPLNLHCCSSVRAEPCTRLPVHGALFTLPFSRPIVHHHQHHLNHFPPRGFYLP